MNLLFEAFTCGPPLLAGIVGFGLSSDRRVRAIALVAAGMSVAGALALLLTGVSLPTEGSLGASAAGWLPLLFALIGLVALALNPLATGRGTFCRILLLDGTTLVSAFARQPLMLSLICTFQAVLIWLELRSRASTRPTARLCIFYLGSSALLMIAAAALMGQAAYPAVSAALLLVAVWIRSGLIPTHSWLPEFAERAPLGIVTMFVCPLLGVHCFYGFGGGDGVLSGPVTLVPTIAAFTALFAGTFGVVQVRARRALGYVLMSETALVVFGLGLQASAQGPAILSAWFSVGVAMAGFAMLMAALEARRGPLLLDRPTGSYERIPLLATAFLISGLASVGLPGTFGFVAEDVLFGAAFGDQPWLTMALVASTALNAVTVLRCFFLLFMGRRDHSGELDLVRREWVALSLVIGVLLFEGLWPNGHVSLLSASQEPASQMERPMVATQAAEGRYEAK